MKVLLVQSYLGGSEANVYPLGLACIKAVLPDHEVQLLDLNVYSDPVSELKKVLESFAPDAVGLSLRNIDSTNKRDVVFYYPFLKEAVAAVKECSDAAVIVGGSGFSMFAERIMEDEPRIDIGVYLEGESVMPVLLERLKEPSSVPSIYYREQGVLKKTAPGSVVHMDDLPLPDRSALPAAPYETFKDALGVETKRGCALDCIYCIYGFLNGRKYRLRSPQKVVDDIEHLLEHSTEKRFTFIDSIFNIPASHARAICEEMIRRKLECRWSAWFSEKGMDESFIDLIQKAGCDHAIFSPDGFTDPVLKKLGKHITNADIIQTHERLRKEAHLEVGYNFFINPPGQSLWAALHMFAFCFKAKLHMKSRVHFEFSTLRIEPHTRLFGIALEEGLVERDADLLYPVSYTQKKTAYIERTYHWLMRMRGR